MTDSHHYDAIVIGSGIGGLATAGLLSRVAGRRVLVLERHTRIGGQTHSFSRGRFRWDVGLHYVGGMQAGELPRALLDYLTDGQVRWERIPAPFDTFIYPGLELAQPDGAEAWRDTLCARFPDEAAALERYFKELKRAAAWQVRHIQAMGMGGPAAMVLRLINRVSRKLALATTAQRLDALFRDPQLRALLASQWGDYGQLPGTSAFAIHAVVSGSYLEGAYYPAGGSGVIARHLARTVTAAGGRCLGRRAVTGILVQGGRAVGVRALAGKAEREERWYAPTIVSDVGARATYLSLLPQELPLPFREQLRAFPQGPSAVSLFLGLKADPRSVGAGPGNYWIHGDLAHERLHLDRTALREGRPRGCFLSFPSARDPAARSHTAEIVALADAHLFAPWRDQPQGRRDADYQALKATLGAGLLERVESRFPGFRALVEYQELGTPLSFEHFGGRSDFYGLPAIPARYRLPWLGARTPVKGLFLTGSDVSTLGVVGALMGGFATAAVLLDRWRLGIGAGRIVSRAMRAGRGASPD